MKDKMKGLLIGLALGTLMTGSLAYATDSTQIDVYFRNLKFMFDGVEKTPDGQKAFIYEGNTYVPARFISESLGKQVEFDDETSTIWFGKNYGGEGAKAVAVYEGGQVSKVELDTYIAAYSFLNGHSVDAGNAAVRKSFVQQLVGIKVLASRATGDSLDKDAEAQAEAQLANARSYFGSASVLAAQLQALQLTELDIKQYFKQAYLSQKGIQQSIGDDAIKAEYDKQIKADPSAFVTATVRHILVATSDAQTGKALRTKDEALARAKEVRDKLAKGGDFTELALTYSDDPGSNKVGGYYKDAAISQFVEPFKKAAAELSLNTLSDPVETSFGYHIMKVEARETQSFEQAKPQLLQQLSNKAYQRFLANEVQGLIQSVTIPDGK